MKQDIQKYDFETPQQGHELRFINKLSSNWDKQEQRKHWQKPKWLYYSAMAACFTLLLISAYVFLSPQPSKPNICEVDLGFKNKMEEVNFYYAGLEQERLEKIKDLPIDTLVLQEELQEMNEILEQLCQDLQTMPNDEKVIGILTQHYRKRLRVLDHIIKQLEQVNYKKEQKDETIDI